MSRTRRARRAAVLAGACALPALVVALPAAATGAGAGSAQQPSWHAELAAVPAAREAGRDGAGVVVAVLDSWVDAAHRDFEGRVLPGADCTGGTCVEGAVPSDPCDHGTHVAGTVASTSFGVAPLARVLPVRVLAYDPSGGGCTGEPDAVTAGIRWAVGNGAQVLNLSLGPDVPGLSGSSSIKAAVAEAARAGVLVVFSAGNASLPVADAYGGSALIVAATGPDGQLASYSQRGAGVDLAAPGGDPRSPDVCTPADCVTSLYPGDGYSVAAGTSMAAPHVSGVAALLIAQEPTRTREQVLARLLDTARPLQDAGRGLLDARAALGVRAAPPPAPPPVAPVDVVVSPAPAVPGAVAPAPVAPQPAPQPAPGPAAAPPAPDRSVPLPPVALAAGLVVVAATAVSRAATRR